MMAVVCSLDGEQIIAHEEADARARVMASIPIFSSETDTRL
jgi:hypothetical protein